jgi:hypothetical protein
VCIICICYLNHFDQSSKLMLSFFFAPFRCPPLFRYARKIWGGWEMVIIGNGQYYNGDTLVRIPTKIWLNCTARYADRWCSVIISLFIRFARARNAITNISTICCDEFPNVGSVATGIILENVDTTWIQRANDDENKTRKLYQ